MFGSRSLPQSKYGFTTTAFGMNGGRVERGDLVRVVPVVAVHRRIPLDVAVDRLGVRVDQQLRRVAPLAVGRIVGTVDPVSVPLTGLDAGDVRVPHVRVDLAQLDPFLGAGGVEQAQLDLRRDLGEAARNSCRSRRRSRPAGIAGPARPPCKAPLRCPSRRAGAVLISLRPAAFMPAVEATPAPARARPVAAPAAAPTPAIRVPDAGRSPRSLPSCPRRTRRTPRRLC